LEDLVDESPDRRPPEWDEFLAVGDFDLDHFRRAFLERRTG
jgi:hypothetical protein